MKYPASEYSDRIMNLNRLEERNLENRKKSLDKEQRTSISLINHEIKRLEVEYETKQDLLKITENQEKINHLTEALNLNFLIDKNNTFLNQLGAETFELKSSENIPTNDNIETKLEEEKLKNQVQLNSDKNAIESVSRPPRKNLSANGRVSRSGSNVRANSANAVKEPITSDDTNAISLIRVSPNVTFDINPSSQNINATPRESISRMPRPKSNTSLEQTVNHSIHLEPSKIDLNNNLITVQKIPIEYSMRSNATKLNENFSSKRIKSPRKNLSKRSKSQSAYMKKNPTESFFPDLTKKADSNLSNQPQQNHLKPLQESKPLRKDLSNEKTKEFVLIKDKTKISINRIASPTKLSKNNSSYITVPLTVKTLNLHDDLFQANENKINSLRENNTLPIIIKK
jgi:hypothetical protein